MKQTLVITCLLALTACGGSSDSSIAALQPQQDQAGNVDTGNTTGTDTTINGTLINTATGAGAAAGDFTRGECVDTSPFGDGFGWNGEDVCIFEAEQVLQQVVDAELKDTMWDCVRRFPRGGGMYELHLATDHTYSTRDILNLQADTWNLIGEWSVREDAVTVHLDYVGDGFDEFTYSSFNNTLNAPLGDLMGEFCDLKQ